MNVLIINPIIYTSETRNIPKVSSIKDSMIYDLCLAFYEEGHNVTLYAADSYKPLTQEDYPFEVIWDKCIFPKIFAPHRFPVLSNLKKYIKQHKFDLIITSELFSKNSLTAYRTAPKKTIIWHELAKHNNMFKKIPSKIWYNIVVPLFMRTAIVVARSYDAKTFAEKYCKNINNKIIDHGVNLDKFNLCLLKNNSFVVCSQLIERKRIDGILANFQKYLKKYNNSSILYIIGEGNLKQALINQSHELNIANNVVFTGKMNHEDLTPLLSEASALLVNTNQDNNMISIVESIATATPIVTTTVPLNSKYIIEYNLGIAKDSWNEDDLHKISENNNFYVNNCVEYRKKLSTEFKVQQFIEVLQNINL